MSTQDSKFEVYVVGYSKMDIVNSNYTEAIVQGNDFNICESIEIADFIYIPNEYSETLDAKFSKDYAKTDCIEVAESLDDLLKYRDEVLFNEGCVI